MRRQLSRNWVIGTSVGLGLTAFACGLAYLPRWAPTNLLSQLSQPSFQISGQSLGLSESDNIRGLASSDPRVDGVSEILPEEIRKRKIEVCGERSLRFDTTSNFDDQATGWFPGRAKILIDPHEALLAKLLLIQRAKKSIDISTYIYTVDESSNAILDELRLAIQRGVNVRFMIDSGGSLGTGFMNQYRHVRALLQARENSLKMGMKTGTVDVVIFHPLGRFMTLASGLRERLFNNVDLSSETALNWNRRSHDKIVMIDKENREDTVAIVGGRNLDNNYYGIPKINEDTYEDLEVLVTNDPTSKDSRTVGGALGKHYQNLFCSKGNRWLRLERATNALEDAGYSQYANLPSKRALDDFEGYAERVEGSPQFRKLYDRMKGSSGKDFLKEGMISVKLSPGNEIQNFKRLTRDVFVDPNEPFVEKLYNGDSIYQQYRRLILNAEKTIDICTPYIFVPRNERECLKKWVMEKPGRRVRILSNSSATSDSALPMAAFEHESAPELMREGPFRCEDSKTHQVVEGVFDNRDGKIQVYQFGRLNNVMFTDAPVRDHRGKLVPLDAFYGKLHAKFGIVDGRYSFIGSHNLDPRSRNLNSETAFFLDSPKAADESTRFFEQLVARSYLYGDPDLQIMNSRPELSFRRKLMSILAFINENFPEAASAN
jgi:putative cardiolipin synthase